jgi:hypothetical protein
MDARGFIREPQQPFRSDREHLEVSPDAEPGHLLIEQAGNAGKLIADQVGYGSRAERCDSPDYRAVAAPTAIISVTRCSKPGPLKPSDHAAPLVMARAIVLGATANR